MRHAILTLVLSAVFSFGYGQAQATLITFDDLPTGPSIPSGYNGFDWSNIAAADSDVIPYTSGYSNGRISLENIAFNPFGAPAAMTVNAGTFDFNSAYFTGAWNDGLNLTIEGYNGATLTHTDTIVLSAFVPTLYMPNWTNLTELHFTAFGGTEAGFGGSGTHFVMDNLTVNASSVPEPCTMTLVGLGALGLVAGAIRRRRQ